MGIDSISSYGGGMYPSFSEENALVQISRNADGLISEVNKFQTYLLTHQNGNMSENKFHSLLNAVVQKFSDFIFSIQQLVVENPAYTEQLIAAKEVYNSLLQPILVENYTHSPDADHFEYVQGNLTQIKASLNDIVDHF